MHEEDQELELITARNDGLINSHNSLQLSSWRGNVDMQFCISKRKVMEYITKYATKCEPRSQTRCILTNIVRDLSTSLKVVQKLLINSVGERDFSAQHLLLQLPLVKSTRDYIILSLDGSRLVEERPEDGDLQYIPYWITTYNVLLMLYLKICHFLLFPGTTLCQRNWILYPSFRR